MSVAELPVQLDREKIAEFCRARGIRKLSLFGSVVRDDFDPARSDVDVLAEFAPGVRPGLKFFGYGEDLAGMKWCAKPCRFMSRHDPKVTLRQLTDYALRAQELCAQNELPAILTDWQKRAAFEHVMDVIGEAVKRRRQICVTAIPPCHGN